MMTPPCGLARRIPSRVPIVAAVAGRSAAIAFGGAGAGRYPGLRFLLNGVDVGGAEGAPWQAWWTLETGQFTLVALATLADGGSCGAPPAVSVLEEQPQPPLN